MALFVGSLVTQVVLPASYHDMGANASSHSSTVASSSIDSYHDM
jgi:hypothetical protein